MYTASVACKDLWRKYGIATTDHVELKNTLRLPAVQKNLEEIKSLTIENEGAERIRAELRQSILDHEAFIYHLA